MVSKINYQGRILQQFLGNSNLPVGGGQSFAFHFFEGPRVNKPLLALEVWDNYPQQWAETCKQAYADEVLHSPQQWAKKAVLAGAKAICLELKSIDPNGQDASAGQVLPVVEQVLSAIDVPLIIWGCDNPEKDGQVLNAIAENFSGKKLILAPIEEVNYQLLSNAAKVHGHTLVATSPIDINLAKQLNILLQNNGVPLQQVLLDPTTGGLGYGLEYSYSVMERIRLAGLQQNDATLALPLICNLGKEIWKSKEARQGLYEGQDNINPGIMMEISAAICLLLAGADILVLSHPQSLAVVSEFVEKMFAPSRLEQGGA